MHKLQYFSFRLGQYVTEKKFDDLNKALEMAYKKSNVYSVLTIDTDQKAALTLIRLKYNFKGQLQIIRPARYHGLTALEAVS